MVGMMNIVVSHERQFGTSDPPSLCETVRVASGVVSDVSVDCVVCTV